MTAAQTRRRTRSARRRNPARHLRRRRAVTDDPRHPISPRSRRSRVERPLSEPGCRREAAGGYLPTAGSERQRAGPASQRAHRRAPAHHARVVHRQRRPPGPVRNAALTPGASSSKGSPSTCRRAVWARASDRQRDSSRTERQMPLTRAAGAGCRRSASAASARVRRASNSCPGTRRSRPACSRFMTSTSSSSGRMRRPISTRG